MSKKNIDRSNLRQIILDFPKQFKPGLEAAEGIKVTGPFDKIAICGMGGSALAGALLKMIWNESPPAGDLSKGDKTPEIVVWRDYGLPKNLGRQTLVIAVSYSGNTEETLSAYRAALNLNLKTIGIAAGGKLEELSLKNKTPFAKIPEAKIPPRSALGYMFAILTRIFTDAGLIPDKISELAAAAGKLNPEGLEAEGKKLAGKIRGKIPLIYASAKHGELAHNWKTKFNENAKIPAFFNVFPELHHNEMNAFENLKGQKKYLGNFHAVIIEDENENLRVSEGIKIFSDFLKKQKVPVSSIKLKREDIFEKIFNNLILADWTSYYAASLRGLDPAPTPIIEKFKKIMAS